MRPAFLTTSVAVAIMGVSAPMAEANVPTAIACSDGNQQVLRVDPLINGISTHGGLPGTTPGGSVRWPSWGPQESHPPLLWSTIDEILLWPKRGGVRNLTNTPGIRDEFPRWSPDGKRVVYASEGRIWTVRTDGTQKRAIAPGSTPAWSPDGKRIAYSRYPDSQTEPEIFTMRTDGSDQRRVTFDRDADTMPAWSPSGRRLAWNNDTHRGSTYIVAQRLDGSEFRRVTWTTDTYDPSWSPDGTRIAFERWDEESPRVHQLWTAAALGGDERDTGATCRDPYWQRQG